MTLVTLEDLGFCAKGEGGAFVEKGRLRVEGGELPVNTDGGGLSRPTPGNAGAVPAGGGGTAAAGGGG
ncbi:hypothetical protein SALBM311S_07870 [Streptomyces alboniger]